jgi:hypothetical protein
VDGFGTPVNVVELNTAFEDRAGWLSWDNCRLYFESPRANDGGTDNDLYVATRTP